jgi:hypothetical protein
VISSILCAYTGEDNIRYVSNGFNVRSGREVEEKVVSSFLSPKYPTALEPHDAGALELCTPIKGLKPVFADVTEYIERKACDVEVQGRKPHDSNCPHQY